MTFLRSPEVHRGVALRNLETRKGTGEKRVAITNVERIVNKIGSGEAVSFVYDHVAKKESMRGMKV